MTYRALWIAAFFGITAAPVAAQDVKACNDDTMAMVMQQVEDAGEETKPTAVAEFQMAKDKMAEGDLDACSVHLTNASNVASEG